RTARNRQASRRRTRHTAPARDAGKSAPRRRAARRRRDRRRRNVERRARAGPRSAPSPRRRRSAGRTHRRRGFRSDPRSRTGTGCRRMSCAGPSFSSTMPGDYGDGKMRRNLTPGKVGIDFLDGFIHGAINDALAKDGIDTSGLYQFYAVRVQKRLGGLSEYEEHIARYAIERCAGRRVVEIGTGLGELPIVLALNGMTTAGVEYDGNRQRAAMALHERIASCFPEILERYEFIR